MIQGGNVGQVSQALIEQGFNKMRQTLGACYHPTCSSITKPGDGSVWIQYLDQNPLQQNGQVLSMFYHPTKQHTATTIGQQGQKQSVAGPGQWALSNQAKGANGNRALYSIL